MKSSALFILFMFLVCVTQAQKRFSEGTAQFEVVVFSNGDTTHMRAVHKLKGGHVRTEITSDAGRSLALYDTREGSGALITEFGSQRLLIALTEADWRDRNSWYTHSGITWLDEQQEILGYTCSKAEMVLKDGTRATVFYSRELIAENTDTDLQFGDLPGMVLEYELFSKEASVRYRAVGLNFDPVAIQQFDVPTTGYRVMEYKNSKALLKK